MIQETTRRVIGSARILRRLPAQRRIAMLSGDDYEEESNRRLRQTVRYAARTVPYYRELFRRERIDPRDIRTAADLTILPILEKATLRDAPSSLRSSSKHGRHAISFSTSGSTGHPLTVNHDPLSLIDNFANCEAEKQVVREILGPQRGVKQISVIHGGSTLHKIWDAYRQWSFLPVPTEESLLSVESPVGDVIEAINAAKPTILSGYGSYLEMLFRHVHGHGIKMHRPSLVSYAADAMTPGGRRMINDDFGIPVLSRYSAVESFRIGFTCKEQLGYHIRSDLCDVRIVDVNGQPVDAGVSGEIVISNLVNRGTVLLNYRLGDIGAFSGRACACGRPMPLLKDLEGRTEDILHLSNGELVHPRAVWAQVGKHREVTRYQFVQHEIDRFELRLVTKCKSDYERIAPAIRASLTKQLFGARIDCVHRGSLAPSAGGKFRPVIALDRLDVKP